jgi:hypothetical protein
LEDRGSSLTYSMLFAVAPVAFGADLRQFTRPVAKSHRLP